jgi:hypothetical protein
MPKTRTRREVCLPQKETIEDSAVEALHSAVSMLQCLLPRVVELADEGKSLKELLQILDIVGKTSSRLSSLVKTQKQMTGGENLADFLNQALAEVVQELGETTSRRSGKASD